MANKKQPDARVPVILPEESIQFFKSFLNQVPDHTSELFSIAPEETKGFKKLSKDDEQYCDDVLSEMEKKTCKVATNVNVDNIKAAAIAAKQFSELAELFTNVATMFSRNALQANGFSYQHAATFEDDVDSAIRSQVKGAIETKEKLESNRKKRNDAAAATRNATEARKNGEASTKKTGKGD